MIPSRVSVRRLDRRLRVDGLVLCVRRADRGLCLNDRAPAASIRLTQ
jgi:hypothetical protein